MFFPPDSCHLLCGIVVSLGIASSCELVVLPPSSCSSGPHAFSRDALVTVDSAHGQGEL